MVSSPLDNVILAFPNLDLSKLQHTSDATDKYNCIAWAAGDTENWWEPDPFNYWYWPIKQRANNLLCYQLAFQSLGYEACTDTTLETGYEKIALFCSAYKPKHAARQLTSGLWTSKLGREIDISHDLEGMQGNVYGTIACIMKRPLI